jgi:hypothetical protein
MGKDIEIKKCTSFYVLGVGKWLPNVGRKLD